MTNYWPSEDEALGAQGGLNNSLFDPPPGSFSPIEPAAPNSWMFTPEQQQIYGQDVGTFGVSGGISSPIGGGGGFGGGEGFGGGGGVDYGSLIQQMMAALGGGGDPAASFGGGGLGSGFSPDLGGGLGGGYGGDEQGGYLGGDPSGAGFAPDRGQFGQPGFLAQGGPFQQPQNQLAGGGNRENSFSALINMLGGGGGQGGGRITDQAPGTQDLLSLMMMRLLGMAPGMQGGRPSQPQASRGPATPAGGQAGFRGQAARGMSFGR